MTATADSPFKFPWLKHKHKASFVWLSFNSSLSVLPLCLIAIKRELEYEIDYSSNMKELC